jgi:hypothetical protein
MTENKHAEKEKKERKKQLKIRLKEKVFEHLTTTHLHGLPHVIRSKYWFMKVLWVLFFLLFIGISAWLTSIIYTAYYSWPVISSVSVYVEQDQKFPAVTICNIEPLLSTYASNVTEEKLSQKQPNFDYSLSSMRDLKDVKKAILDGLSANFSFNQKQLYGYSIDETIINCEFNGLSCTCQYDNRSDCTPTSQEFIWYYSYKYGNCYTFNSGYTYNTDKPNENSTKTSIPIKTSSRDNIDSEYGLNLEIYVGSDFKYSLEQYGLIVFIHNQSSLPESSNGIILAPGTKTSIGVEKSFNSYTPNPFSSCEDLDSFNFDRTYYNAILAASLTYTQSTCLDVCLRQQIINQCNCSYLEFIQIKKSNPCIEDAELLCANSIFYKFWSVNSYTACSSYCPLECYSQKYSYTISTSGYPTDLYAQILSNTSTVKKHFDVVPTVDQIKNSVLKLNVHFKNDKYTFTTQSRQYYAFDLFANSGGIFNLFIGFSLLACAQFLDLIYELVMIYWESRPKKTKKTAPKPSDEESLKQLVNTFF